MKRFVVDASVAVKWALEEQFSAIATSLLQGADHIHAPAHWLAETLNAVWAKHVTRAEISLREATESAAFYAALPVESVPLADLAMRATEIAIALRVTVYDSLYLALAERLTSRSSPPTAGCLSARAPAPIKH